MENPMEIKFFPPKNSDDETGHGHRQLIGWLGFWLTPILWLVAGVRAEAGQSAWSPLHSVSAYYYTGSVAVFAGVLVALSVYFFTYKGYGNEGYTRDRVAAIAAAVTAILVALFPTNAPTGFEEPSWWTPVTGRIHYISAVILFVAFSFFAFFQFPKTHTAEKKDLDRDKKFRNAIYRISAIGILICIAWIAYNVLVIDAPIFWPEAIALELFALSWLVKGKVDYTAKAVVKQSMHYARNPGQMTEDLKMVVTIPPSARQSEASE